MTASPNQMLTDLPTIERKCPFAVAQSAVGGTTQSGSPSRHVQETQAELCGKPAKEETRRVLLF